MVLHLLLNNTIGGTGKSGKSYMIIGILYIAKSTRGKYSVETWTSPTPKLQLLPLSPSISNYR